MGETIGQRLKRLREERGLSQGDVAKIIDIDRTTYNKYEKDVIKPVRTVIRLAICFNTTTDYILCNTDDNRDFKTIEYMYNGLSKESKDIVDLWVKTFYKLEHQPTEK